MSPSKAYRLIGIGKEITNANRPCFTSEEPDPFHMARKFISFVALIKTVLRLLQQKHPNL